ncbi:hypothetical protein [Lysobacter sp. 22409]|uniref:hypothetical protein n=1 Tax=Lysobacter sp. 22409 TaxID=3453917 RepID=UPI003F8663B3
MADISLRFLAAALAIGALAGCGNFNCDEDHESVALARSLPQRDLALLFSEAESVARAKPMGFDHTRVRTPLPKFDLSPLIFRGYGKHASVKLAGCFDHGVYLSLEDLNSSKGQIELSWGEGPASGHRVLWSQLSAPSR